MPIDSIVTPFQWTPNMPPKVAFKVEITADLLNVKTEADRQKLAMEILESIEQGACKFQEFVVGMRTFHKLDVSHWDYPFVPFKDDSCAGDSVE